MFSVDADATQRMIDYSGLQVYRFLPRRAIVTLILTHFVDSDLGAYHEYSTYVSVNPPGSKPAGFVPCRPRTFITCSSTRRSPWKRADDLGLPKVMADFTVRDGKQFGFDASIDGQLVTAWNSVPG